MYTEILRALVAGMIVGAVFNFIKLPIPAPGAIAGIAGIIGIYLGFILVSNLK